MATAAIGFVVACIDANTARPDVFGDSWLHTFLLQYVAYGPMVTLGGAALASCLLPSRWAGLARLGMWLAFVVVAFQSIISLVAFVYDAEAAAIAVTMLVAAVLAVITATGAAAARRGLSIASSARS